MAILEKQSRAETWVGYHYEVTASEDGPGDIIVPAFSLSLTSLLVPDTAVLTLPKWTRSSEGSSPCLTTPILMLLCGNLSLGWF